MVSYRGSTNIAIYRTIVWIGQSVNQNDNDMNRITMWLYTRLGPILPFIKKSLSETFLSR